LNILQTVYFILPHMSTQSLWFDLFL
jgi:hypothetical protein